MKRPVHLMMIVACSMWIAALSGCGDGGETPGSDESGSDSMDAVEDAGTDTPSEIPTDSTVDARDSVADEGDGLAADSVGDSVSDAETGEPDVPFCPDCTIVDPTAAESYAARQAEYLAACAENNGPGQGNTYGQVCRVKAGLPVNTDAIASGIEDLTLREDCSDFRAAALVRVLYLNEDSQVLDATTYGQIVDTLVNFKYWMTEPGQDKMCYWSENHQILFHSSEYLIGSAFPETVFPNAGMTGQQHADHARPLILKWLNLRGALGFSEWHSNVYFNEDIPALVNLVDFSPDEEISMKASMVLDVIAYDMAMNYFKGYFATTHGRTYEREMIDGFDDHTTEGGWMLTGLGQWEGNNNFSASFLATSRYQVPDIVELIAAESASGEVEHRQRDSLDIVDGPKWGLTYDQDDDIPTWAGFSAIAAPEIVNGTLAFVDKYDLWEGFLFGDLPDYLVELVKANMGTQDIVNLSTDAEVLSRGIALQAISTYTYRTSHYQISAAQDYNPGYFSAQTLNWMAVLDDKAFVVTSLPTSVELGGESVDVAGDWVGSWMPRATVYRNAGIIQYRADKLPDLLSGLFIPGLNHAYFKRSAFDEVREQAGWVIGRKGDGYLAIYSRAPTAWSTENDYELTTQVQDNIWLVQLGSVDEFESFDAFVAAVAASPIAFADDGAVTWTSPSVGEMKVGWTGPFTVAGNEIDLGPYDRFDNRYSAVRHGSRVTRITKDGRTLELDFAKGTRRVLVHP